MLRSYCAAESIRAADGSTDVMLFAFDANEKLNRDALQAKQSDERMDAFIRQNKRFILGCAYKTVRRFVTESDDEWSVALIAFHEAVQTYDPGRGDFKAFAALVIKRRLLDEFDKQVRRRREISADLSGAEPDGDDAAPIQLEAVRAVAAQSIAASESGTAIRDEIEAMGETLRTYGFSFFDLADCSPKAQKTKDTCAVAVNALLRDEELLARMRQTKTIPAAALCAASGVKRKILENHRKYIIAAAEILSGDYPGLAEYLRFIRKGSEGK